MLIWGMHPVLAAIANKNRKIKKIFITKDKIDDINKIDDIKSLPSNIKIDLVEKKYIDHLVPINAVHQGVVADISELQNINIKDINISKMIDNKQRPQFIILDHIIDPHNVGAICRNAAAFKATAIIMTNKHSPNINGFLAKSAAGALEYVPIILVPNLSNAMEYLKTQGIFCIGLSEKSSISIKSFCNSNKYDDTFPIALVFGSEGSGLRRLTLSKCDIILNIDTSETFSVLNVSCSSAIAMSKLFVY